MFLTIDKLFTTTTSFQHTVTALSLHNRISTSTTTSLQHLKSFLPPKIIIIIIFVTLYSFYEKQVSLINKLQPLSYQFTSSITPRLPLNASPPTPKIYNATALHYSHILNTHKKLSVRVVHRRPNIRSHSVLLLQWSRKQDAMEPTLRRRGCKINC